MINISQEEFAKLKCFIQHNYGIDLSKKKHLIEGRLNSVIMSKGFSNFEEYLDMMYNDKSGKELTELLNKLTTNHTFFMRETSHFEYYKEVVLPYLAKNVKDKNLGIWSAGCSSGEEPFTLAMLNDEFFNNKGTDWDTRILATDISERALNIGKTGIYSGESICEISDIHKKKYLKPCDNGYIFQNNIRKNVIFQKFNLMDDFKFKRKFHVIFCRNVMIYFDKETKIKLVNKFYDVMEDGGFLFIGHSEYLDKDYIDFKYVKSAIYRKG